MTTVTVLRMALSEDVPAPPPAEVALVRRARGGDASAFRTLFERHAPAIWRFVRDCLREEAAADEATQETFVRAHAHLAQLREEERLLPWLMGIARRVCLEDGRRRRHLEPVGGAEESESLGEVGPPPATPEELLLDRELEGLLAQALSSLREERRAALLLRLDHGLAYEEIAAVMGWTLPKVKNEIHRARLQLRNQLAPHVGGGR